LVSGFNTEYSGAFFAFIFLSEYRVLLLSCVLISYLFFGWCLPPSPLFRVLIPTLFFSFLFIWVRITYCRFRYDFLIMFAWKSLLPCTLLLFIILLPCTLL
jgi:NADH:ubiquinone oxidoreductase subunit H